MKLLAYKYQLEEDPELWLKRAGYAMLNDRQSGETSFSRRLSRDHYPRFHIYVEESRAKNNVELITLNLHLDQKKPGYEGQKRHNAEYDGEIVEAEAKRLSKFLLPAKV